MKSKSHYLCSSCGNETPKWAGKCSFCGEWNTLTEFKEAKTAITGAKSAAKAVKLKKFSEFKNSEVDRILSGLTEVDRVLGGGLVAGEVLLIGGNPGIGKSTLILSVAERIAKQGRKVIYLSGEESGEQVSLRATRMKVKSDNIFFLGETEIATVLTTLNKENPELLIVDSIQTMYLEEVGSLPGSVPQLRACSAALIEYAKQTGTPIILIGHMTKGGDIAGPQILTHMVDAVFSLEGDDSSGFRFLRSLKNRFGPTDEVGVFEMGELGMREIINPSELFLEGREENAIGSVVTATLEGTRPVLAEIQALTSFTSFGYPKRTALGIDLNRMQLLVAVLSKHAGLKLDNQDVYTNVVGGFSIRERAIDLAVALAIAASFLKKQVSAETVVLGELGLSGELRSIPRIEARVSEAEKLGFRRIIGPRLGKGIKLKIKTAKYIEIKNIAALVDLLKSEKL